MTHRPRKRFGQHFLHDPAVIARIVAAIAPRPGDELLEIGPGLGALTLPLLAKVQRLMAVELDRDAARELRILCAAAGELLLYERDALTLDLDELPAPGPLRLVGNLPYNISTPLLFHFLRQKHRIRDMHFMLQKEVVQRMVAPPGGRAYGRLSVMISWHCEAQALFDVGPGAFRPPPRVWSSVVRLLPRSTPPCAVHDDRLLEQVVAEAFMQRRKTLRRALCARLTVGEIEAAGVDPGLRAERLDIDGFARLANAVHEKRAGSG